jgi:hypothetical protein
MMAVSCFVRGESVPKDSKIKTFAAPLYFDFGLQIYNSVFPSFAYNVDRSVVLRWKWLPLRIVPTELVMAIGDYSSVIDQS